MLKPKENQGLQSIEGVLFKKSMKTDEIKNEIDEIKKREEKIEQKGLNYETNNYLYNFP